MIDSKVVGVASTQINDGGTNITVTADIAATVWLALDVPAVVGKGIRLDLYAPKHTFYGLTGVVNAIATSGTATLGIHVG